MIINSPVDRARKRIAAGLSKLKNGRLHGFLRKDIKEVPFQQQDLAVVMNPESLS